jgi:hypothetical protein
LNERLTLHYTPVKNHGRAALAAYTSVSNLYTDLSNFECTMTAQQQEALNMDLEDEDGPRKKSWVDSMNRAFALSSAGRYFAVNERFSTFSQELRAGTVTFLTVRAGLMPRCLPHRECLPEAVT